MALADTESAFAKKEAQAAKDALSRAIKDFRESQDFKNEVLKGGYVSYYVGYEDSKDAVKRLYPNLDLSNIIASSSREKIVEETALIEGVALAASESASTIDEAVPESATTKGHETRAAMVTDIAEEEIDW